MMFNPISAHPVHNRSYRLPPISDRQLRTRYSQPAYAPSTITSPDYRDSQDQLLRKQSTHSTRSHASSMENADFQHHKTKTGRISKALKGRKVHECPHCGKV
jgi:hypothetical protein